jgi:hypothetical protein
MPFRKPTMLHLVGVADTIDIAVQAGVVEMSVVRLQNEITPVCLVCVAIHYQLER